MRALILLAALALVPASHGTHRKKQAVPPKTAKDMQITGLGCKSFSFGSAMYALYGVAFYGPKHKQLWQHNLGVFRPDLRALSAFAGGVTTANAKKYAKEGFWALPMGRACKKYLKAATKADGKHW